MSDQRSNAAALAVPGSRLSRLARLGGMASGVAGGMAWHGARELAQGRRPDLRQLALTPGNARRIASELARMRGAAMKIGQLVSMDAGQVLPPELAEIFAGLRSQANHMPPAQLRSVLNQAWGEGWLSRFARFDVRPIAAASIGQVHRARTRDGRDLAIKVQYPGVRRSIDSDVANVGALIRMSGLLPPGIDLAPLLEAARAQLHEEADYLREGEQLDRFARLLSDAPEFVVPGRHADLTTASVLAMTHVTSRPVEEMAEAPQAERDRIMERLVALVLRELFEFRLMQTDPNFANYRVEAETGRLVLLDFGATRSFGEARVAGLRELMRAGLRGDDGEIAGLMERIGYIAPSAAPHHRAALLEMTGMVMATLRRDAAFDFAGSDLAMRLRDRGMQIGMDREFDHVPPLDLLFLQRKIAGLYLLGARLGARVPLAPLLERHLPA